MWIFNLTAPYQFKCIPRFYNGGELTFFLRDELRDITYNIDFLSVSYSNNILILDFDEPILIEGQSFEITINKDDVLIYRGKAFATAQTDLENFQLNKGVLKV
jgi:hypothetical protein